VKPLHVYAKVLVMTLREVRCGAKFILFTPGVNKNIRRNPPHTTLSRAASKIRSVRGLRPATDARLSALRSSSQTQTCELAKTI